MNRDDYDAIGEDLLKMAEDKEFAEKLAAHHDTQQRKKIHEPPAVTCGLTDLGNARRLVKQYKDIICYVPQYGWLCYDGKLWLQDSSGAIVRLAKKTVMAIYAEVLQVEDYEVRQALSKHAVKSESWKYIAHMIELTKTEAEVIATTDDFDRDPLLFNVQNGTIDLSTGERRRHNVSDHITKMAPVTFDPDAQCPCLKFLMQIMDNNISLIRFLQRIIGYS